MTNKPKSAAPPSASAPAPDPFAGHSDAEVYAALDEVRGKPVAPSLLPRVLAALEAGYGYDQLRALAAELRRYIASVEGAVLPTPGEIALKNRLDAAEKRIAELESALRWALGEEDHFPPRELEQGQYWWRIELRRRAKLAARTASPAAQGKGEGK